MGLWHAALVPTPQYPVLFDVRIVRKGKGLAAFLVNGAIEVPFTSVAWDGKALTLELAHYDAKLVAERHGDTLEGRYLRTVVSGVADVPFEASRTAPALPPAPADGRSLAGTWDFEIGEPPAKVERLTGLFTQQGAALAGTLLSVTGDYGALHGWFDGERLVLTVFDGVHVYRFDGELLGDGTLAGEYRSRTNPPVSWKARKLDAAAAGTFAGTTKTARAGPVVSQIEGFEGYPTTLFLDREHRIVGTLSGFDGPATGGRYARAKRDLEERVKALLD